MHNECEINILFNTFKLKYLDTRNISPKKVTDI